jgi:MATE family multidrug resistance protein
MEAIQEDRKQDTFSAQVRAILRLALPSILQQVLLKLTDILNLAFIGHLNNPAMLAGVGMGNMTQTLCGLSIVYGFNSALDTLISQAAGSKNIRLCGLYLNKGRFIMTLLFIPIVSILVNTEALLVGLGQNKEVAQYAQQYVMVYLPGLYISGLADCQRRFLNNFGLNVFSFLSGFIGMCLHLIWLYVFLIRNGMGIVGIGYANMCSQIVVYAMLLIFTYYQEHLREAWIWPDASVVKAMGSYFALALPSTFCLVLDWWVWELMVLISGYLGVTE